MPQTTSVRPQEAAASGMLSSKPLAHLLVYALERKLNGTFELVDPTGATARIVVSGGKVARVATSETVTYLGHVLYELGAIDDTTLSMSLAEVAASRRLHGQVLLENGTINEGELIEALVVQRSRKLQHAFALPPKTSFAFYPDADLVGERPNDVEPMDPLASIWRGVREHPSWDHVRATIARVGGRPIRLLATASLERLALDDDERNAVECLRVKASTVPELAIVGGLTIQATDILAYFLVITKQVEVVDRSMAMTSSAPPGASGPPPAISGAPPAISGAPPPMNMPSIPPGPLQVPSSAPMRSTAPGAPFASGEYQRKISFSMTAVSPDSGTIRIPSPVPNRVPSPMPGRIPSPMPGRLPLNIPRSMTPMPGSVASQIPRSVTPPGSSAASQMPRSMSPMPGSIPAQGPLPGSVASSIPPRATSSSAPPGRMTSSMPPPADLARKKSILDRAKWIDQEDFFRMLMVGRDASTEDVRAAFLRAAKVWHPDSLPASIQEVRAECERVFVKITKAYETLADPSRRRAYEKTVNAEMRDSFEAEHLMSQAEMHLTLGERSNAEELARKALVAAPSLPEAVALLAYLEATDPRKGSPEHTGGKVKVLDMAIAKDPMCRRAHYYRAALLKRLGDHEEAIRDLRVAVTNDPDDVDAQRELKLYERQVRDGIIQLRSLSPSGTKKPSFIDRLLKK